jgi:GNAT superfamily N-acetyltransferase
MMEGSIDFRLAVQADIPVLAHIRAAEWGSEDYWISRISGYMNGELHPRDALKPRIVYVASQHEAVAGFIAGHLTRRYNCDGELQWINVRPEHRGRGVASALLRPLATWFLEQKALRVCVDVDPGNPTARRFYARHGAVRLNRGWMVWNDISATLGDQSRHAASDAAQYN